MYSWESSLYVGEETTEDWEGRNLGTNQKLYTGLPYTSLHSHRHP